MRKINLSLLILLLLAACSSEALPPVPTLAKLPTATLEAATVVVSASTVAVTDLPTQPPITETPVIVADVATQPPTTESPVALAAVPTQIPTVLPVMPSSSPVNTVEPTTSPLPTATPSVTKTPTASPSPLPTLAPSLTITSTITPTPSPSFTPTEELGLLGDLVALSRRATILPPEQLYNPPTLTALYFIGLSAPATLGAGTAAALLPTLPAAGNCALQPPPVLANAIAVDPALIGLIGCPQVAAAFPAVTAVQSFERGSMIFVQGPPNAIYVLTFDGRFRRYDDTWVPSIDPESGGETPPLGLIEPRRGFGKVWRMFPDVRSLLGWAVTEEVGATASSLPFERGRAISLPQRNETILLIEDPGGLTGSWRSAGITF